MSWHVIDDLKNLHNIKLYAIVIISVTRVHAELKIATACNCLQWLATAYNCVQLLAIACTGFKLSNINQYFRTSKETFQLKAFQ